MSALPTSRPSRLTVLRTARALLLERGWTPSIDDDDMFGETGPLTINRALWRASRWQGTEKVLVDPRAAGDACRALCGVIYGPEAEITDPGFTDLGRWERKEGRTQAQVLRVFDRWISAASKRFVKAIFRLDEKDTPDGAGVFWLLERVDTEAPTYLRDFSADDAWETTAPLEAKRFDSEADASGVLSYLDSRGLPSSIWEPREHEFVA